MSGLAFSSDAAARLIAAYKTPDMEQQRDATLRRLDLKPGERVVDIGCRPGFLSKSMAETEKRNESFFSLNRYFFSVEKTRDPEL